MNIQEVMRQLRVAQQAVSLHEERGISKCNVKRSDRT